MREFCCQGAGEHGLEGIACTAEIDFADNGHCGDVGGCGERFCDDATVFGGGDDGCPFCLVGEFFHVFDQVFNIF